MRTRSHALRDWPELDGGVGVTEPEQTGDLIARLEAALVKLQNDLNRLHDTHTELGHVRAEREGLVAALPLPLLEVHRDGTLTLVNRALGDLLGQAPAALIGRPLADLADDEAGRAGVAAALRGPWAQPPTRAPMRLKVDGGGRAVDLEVAWVLPGHAAVTPDTVVGVVRPVASAQEGDPDWNAMEAQWRQVVEHSPDYILLLDRQGVVRFLNRTRHSRLTVKHVIGTPLVHWIAAEFKEATREAVERVLVTGMLQTVEAALRVRGQEEDAQLWLSLRIVPCAQGGRTDAVLVIGQDITRRKLAAKALQDKEEHYRLLLEHAQDTVTILDAEGRIRYESPAFERLLGYRPDKVLGIKASDFVHPEDRPGAEAAFKAVLANPGVPLTRRFRMPHRDGAYRHLEVTSVNLLPVPTVRGIVVNSRDVTERIQLEDQLRQAQKMEAVGQLAGGLAHDFNNLLHVVSVLTETILFSLDGEDARRKDLEKVQFAVDRGQNITRQLLAISRRSVLQPSLLDVNDSIRTLLRLLEPVLGKTIQVRFLPGEGLSPVYADPAMLEQVLLNLCLNARDAMPEGGEIAIASAGAPAPRGLPVPEDADPQFPYVALSVSDTGSGIPAEMQARIFEPFFTTKKPGKGTGLGLSTAYGIVKQHNGLIAVESTPGKGSTFRVYLPTVRPDAAVQPPAEPLPSDAVLLVADDDEFARRLAAEVLGAVGYRVVTCEDGLQAWEVFQQSPQPVALAVLDMVMPGLDGLEVARRIRQSSPATRIVLCSGYGAESLDIDQIRRHGLLLLPKPYSGETLVEKVRDALSRRAAAGD
jgi:PAS domain S-box-containing protein